MSRDPKDNLAAIAEPPEVLLTAPVLYVENSTWLVVAKNRRVDRSWQALMQQHPENTRRCYRDLCEAPMARQPGRVFPLKGKKYKGVWEYEVTSGDRVFYVPDETLKKVFVYYAGSHLCPAPIP